jgi:hypothetical protein
MKCSIKHLSFLNYDWVFQNFIHLKCSSFQKQLRTKNKQYYLNILL